MKKGIPKKKHVRTSKKGKQFYAGKGMEKQKVPIKKSWVCPRCGKTTEDYPAISRRDNETKICSQCGLDEALIDFTNHKENVKTNQSEMSKPKKVIQFHPLERVDYYKIAEQVELGYGHRDAYIKFMLKAFPKQMGSSYAYEWAGRFKRGTHWAHADKNSRKALREAYGVY